MRFHPLSGLAFALAVLVVGGVAGNAQAEPHHYRKNFKPVLVAKKDKEWKQDKVRDWDRDDNDSWRNRDDNDNGNSWWQNRNQNNGWDNRWSNRDNDDRWDRNDNSRLRANRLRDLLRGRKVDGYKLSDRQWRRIMQAGNYDLPPGIARNVARGKEIPPGIRRNMAILPEDANRYIGIDNYYRVAVIDDSAILYDPGNNRILNVLRNIIR